MDYNEYLALRIQVRFGVPPETRSEILFNCGSCLVDRLRAADVPIEADEAFWQKFTRTFNRDDELILGDLDSWKRDYATMKSAVVDVTFERMLTMWQASSNTKLTELSEVAVQGRPSQPSDPKKAPTGTSDVWRKRLIAAIGGYLSLKGERADIDRIKAVACRAAKKDDFNRITVPQLRSLYNAFCKQQNDLRSVQALAQQQPENLKNN